MSVQDLRKRMTAQTVRDPAQAEVSREHRKKTQSILSNPRL